MGSRFGDSKTDCQPGFSLSDVWVRYRVKYHRPKSLHGMIAGNAARVLRLKRRARRDEEEFWALRGITLSAGPGEVIGIIGSNGAGKSTLLRVLARIIRPDKGSIDVRGTIGTLLSFGAGFSPQLTGRENVFMNGVILGLTPEQIRERLDAIQALSGIDRFFDAPVAAYSSGMRARLGFSVAVHINPDVLLIDEVVQAGDTSFQKRAGNILEQFHGQGKVIALATHSPEAVRLYCTRAVWLEHGQTREEGPPEDVVASYIRWSEADAKTKKSTVHTGANGRRGPR